VTRKFTVSGVVQGVGYRYFVLRQARGLVLSGWVRNLPDGRVEVVARGSGGALSALEDALQKGPSHSHVTNVEKVEISDDAVGISGFDIR
jgi:acylphosphatase